MASVVKVRSQEEMEALVRLLAEALDLPVKPEWTTGVAQQLITTLSMADLVESANVSDEAQPAPVYRL